MEQVRHGIRKKNISNMENNHKPFWRSRTIIVAFVQGLAGLAVALATEYPTVGWIAILKSVVDVALRFATSSPLG